MRRITTFEQLLQVIWDIPNQAFTVYATQAFYNNKELAYWKLQIWDVPNLVERLFTNDGAASHSFCLSLSVVSVNWNISASCWFPMKKMFNIR